MRDPIREADIERASGAAQVEVDVADNGIAVVTIRRDDLDRLVAHDRYDDGFERGYTNDYGDGRADAQESDAQKSSAA